MKILLSVLVLSFGISALATSPINGPYLQLKMGGMPVCNVLPGKDLNTETLEGYVRASQKEPMKVVAVYVMAHQPPTVIFAGVAPGLNFEIYSDSGSHQARVGSASNYLIGLVRKSCPKF